VTDTNLESKTIQELKEQVSRQAKLSSRELLESNSSESNFCTDLGGIFLDWSHQRLDTRVLDLLFRLADERNLIGRIRDQFQGQVINRTEVRSVLHTAMRASTTSLDIHLNSEVIKERNRLVRFVESVRNGTLRGLNGDRFTDILHIGIGGSHLGQKLYYSALGPPKLQVHFLSNVDPANVSSVLEELNPSSTLFIVASKSMRTPETLLNFARVKSWYEESTGSSDTFEQQCVCISSIAESDIATHHFRVPDSVGGRFSIWSSMALPIVISHGTETFESFLEGAREIDRLTADLPIESNPSLILALLAFWNSNLLKSQSHVVATYVHRLEYLVPYLQQLELESNGKSVDLENRPLQDTSAVAVWGGVETNGQHTWHQFLHQGTSTFSIDLIGTTEHINDTNGSWQLANCLAQRRLLFEGSIDKENPHKNVPGLHGCNLILLDQIDAKTLGKLIALYEHKVAFLGFLWNVNSFDQFGVEQGKVLAEEFHSAIELGETEGLNTRDQILINRIHSKLN